MNKYQACDLLDADRMGLPLVGPLPAQVVMGCYSKPIPCIYQGLIPDEHGGVWAVVLVTTTNPPFLWRGHPSWVTLLKETP